MIQLLSSLNWGTVPDIIQAICAIIAVPVTLVTLYKLVARDRDRENEIVNLTEIAKKITDLVTQNKVQNLNIRRPEILIKGTNDLDKILFEISNSNRLSLIKETKLVYDNSDNFSLMKSIITTQAGKQYFEIELIIKSNFELISFAIEYMTEEGYEYIQDIKYFKGERFSPSSVYNKEYLNLQDLN